MNIKLANTWKESNDVYCKVNNVWKTIQTMSVKVNNVWKTVIDNSEVFGRVGGTIFYIDSSSTGGTYKFYDQNMNEISNVAVGSTPYYYSVTGKPVKDKYYVFKDNNYYGFVWGSGPTDKHGTQDGIGKGKSNTALVVERYASVVQNTIWKKLKELNNAETDGCNDWFVGSKAEVEELRKTNLASKYFISYYVWSSTEADTLVWLWNYKDKSWHEVNPYYPNETCLVIFRAF